MFYVTGEVTKPDAYKYEEGATVLKAISMAGGFTKIAASLRSTHSLLTSHPLRSTAAPGTEQRSTADGSPVPENPEESTIADPSPGVPAERAQDDCVRGPQPSWGEVT